MKQVLKLILIHCVNVDIKPAGGVTATFTKAHKEDLYGRERKIVQ